MAYPEPPDYHPGFRINLEIVSTAEPPPGSSQYHHMNGMGIIYFTKQVHFLDI